MRVVLRFCSLRSIKCDLSTTSNDTMTGNRVGRVSDDDAGTDAGHPAYDPGDGANEAYDLCCTITGWR